MYFNLGNTYASQGRWEESASFYSRFIDKTTDNHDRSLALYNIGYIHAKNGKWKEAAKFLYRALQLNPDDLDAKHNFELVLTKINEQEENKDESQQKKLPPPTPYAKQIKEKSDRLILQRKYKEAYQLLQEALKKDETVGNYQDHTKRIGNIVTIIDN